MKWRLKEFLRAECEVPRLKLGQVRWSCDAGPRPRPGWRWAEYSPLTIKSSVVDYGRAEKQQVQHMVTRLFELGGGSGADGCVGCAGDLRFCHLHTAGTLERAEGRGAGDHAGFLIRCSQRRGGEALASAAMVAAMVSSSGLAQQALNSASSPNGHVLVWTFLHQILRTTRFAVDSTGPREL